MRVLEKSVLDNVRWISFRPNTDSRGVLTAIEGGQTIPFDIKRVFYVSEVVADRAGHSHRDTHEVVICLTGQFEIELSDGTRSATYLMQGSHRGLLLPPMVFIRLLRFAPGTVMLVLADTHYDPTQSIRSWEEYLQAIQEQSA